MCNLSIDSDSVSMADTVIEHTAFNTFKIFTNLYALSIESSLTRIEILFTVYDKYVIKSVYTNMSKKQYAE